MLSREGFSLMEMMLVVAIIGVMASYGMITFGKQLERDKLRKALENVKVIYNMEKRYKLDNDQYFSKKTAAGACTAGAIDRTAINTGLGIFIRDNDAEFSYALTGTCAGSPAQTTGYSLVVKRLTGRCTNSTITLGQAGGEPVIAAVRGCSW